MRGMDKSASEEGRKWAEVGGKGMPTQAEMRLGDRKGKAQAKGVNTES
jgi:hypothetical protein